jgi:hypothetical protein
LRLQLGKHGPGHLAAVPRLKTPVGVAGWETKIVDKLPENLKGSLTSVEEIEAELSREENQR